MSGDKLDLCDPFPLTMGCQIYTSGPSGTMQKYQVILKPNVQGPPGPLELTNDFVNNFEDLTVCLYGWNKLGCNDHLFNTNKAIIIFQSQISIYIDIFCSNKQTNNGIYYSPVIVGK